MATCFKLEVSPGASLHSLVKGYILTHQTQGSSPNTVEYYRGILSRFLWFAELSHWPDDIGLINEWQIREFLGYVGVEKNRWQKVGNGSESSARKSSASTVHHYYGALRAFFNWMVREGYVKETPFTRVKMPKPKPKVIQPLEGHRPVSELVSAMVKIKGYLCKIPVKAQILALICIFLLLLVQVQNRRSLLQ